MKSILQADKYECFLCPSYGELDKHHIFNGAGYRQKSEADGCYIYVCRRCHRLIHENWKKRLEVKKMAQREWEKLYGTREDFIDRYGKSYL